MCETAEAVERALRALLDALDPNGLPGEGAARQVEIFSTIERLAIAGRLLVTPRVIETGAWRSDIHRSPAEWMAATTKTLTGRARVANETSSLLERLPATRAALRDGILSEIQASELAAAAAADPGAEASLLELSATEDVRSFRDRCREVAAAAISDEERDEKIHRARYLRRWVDARGAFRLEASLTVEDGAAIWARLGPRADELRTAARLAGRPEPEQAFAADALVRALCGSEAQRATIVVHVDHAALSRGYTEPGELSALEGLGPVPISTVTRLASRSVVELLSTDGADVMRVVRVGRTIPWQFERALKVLYPRCAVRGCGEAEHLEIHHIIDITAGGETKLENLVRLCRYHHGRRTFDGWVLERAGDTWIMRPPRAGEPIPDRDRFRRRKANIRSHETRSLVSAPP